MSVNGSSAPKPISYATARLVEARMHESSPLTIGVLSKRTDVHVETILYYERIWLLPKPTRSVGGHRHYTNDHTRRLIFVRRSRELGFSLDEARASWPRRRQAHGVL